MHYIGLEHSIVNSRNLIGQSEGTDSLSARLCRAQKLVISWASDLVPSSGLSWKWPGCCYVLN